MTKRRFFVVAVGVFLPYILTALGSYLLATHTTDGRLAMWLIVHSQEMNDQQLAQAIGQDPFEVIRRSALMAKAIEPTVAILMGILVSCFERRSPGRLTALVMIPYSLYHFNMTAFSVVRPPAQAALKAAEVIATDAAIVSVAVFASLAFGRLLMRYRPPHQQVRAQSAC